MKIGLRGKLVSFKHPLLYNYKQEINIFKRFSNLVEFGNVYFSECILIVI